MGTLASATNAPRSTANPPRSSTSMVNHAIRCGAGTPSASRILTNASGPLKSLATPCCMKPTPTIRRNGTGAQRAIERRLDASSATSRTVVMLGNLTSEALMTMAGRRAGGDERECRVRKGNALLLEEPLDAGDVGADDARLGDHQWLVPIADVVGVEPPLLWGARLDQEHRLRPIYDNDNGLCLVEDEAVTAAHDRAARKGHTEHEPAIGPPPSTQMQSVFPSECDRVAGVAANRGRERVLAMDLLDDDQNRKYRCASGRTSAGSLVSS